MNDEFFTIAMENLKGSVDNGLNLIERQLAGIKRRERVPSATTIKNIRKSSRELHKFVMEAENILSRVTNKADELHKISFNYEKQKWILDRDRALSKIGSLLTKRGFSFKVYKSSIVFKYDDGERNVSVRFNLQVFTTFLTVKMGGDKIVDKLSISNRERILSKFLPVLMEMKGKMISPELMAMTFISAVANSFNIDKKRRKELHELMIKYSNSFDGKWFFKEFEDGSEPIDPLNLPK